ncbi:unnamed protein product, partial [Urochloa humidicola]
AEDLERKPVLPRFKLVRDPGSFGYRRLLPLLNEMAKNGHVWSRQPGSTLASTRQCMEDSESIRGMREVMRLVMLFCHLGLKAVPENSLGSIEKHWSQIMYLRIYIIVLILFLGTSRE